MKHLKLSLYIVVGLFWSDLALAVPPASEKDITVYPGASLVKQMSEPETPNVRVNYSAEYTVSDTIDKVHAYYRKQFSLENTDSVDRDADKAVNLLKKGFSRESLDELRAGPETGQTVLHQYSVKHISLGALDKDGHDYIESEDIRRAKRRAVISKYRKADLNGDQWISGFKVSWKRTDTNGDKTELWLYVTDESFHEDKKRGEWSYTPTTRIEIKRTSTVMNKAERNERKARLIKEQEAEADRNVAIPTENELGRPLYDNARYDRKRSEDESRFNETVQHVFVTSDPLEKVKTFYQKSLGEQPQNIGIGYAFMSGITVTSARYGGTEIEYETEQPSPFQESQF